MIFKFKSLQREEQADYLSWDDFCQALSLFNKHILCARLCSECLINPHQLPTSSIVVPSFTDGDAKAWRGRPKPRTDIGKAILHPVAQDRNLGFEPKQLGPGLQALHSCTSCSSFLEDNCP